MNYIKLARAIGGLASVFTLLILIILDFWFESVMLSENIIGILLLLIGGLLAADIILNKLPVEIIIKERDNNGT